MVEKGFEWDGNGLPPLVVVEWDDCFGNSSWQKVKRAFEMEPGHMRTAGWLLEWTDQVLRISGSVDVKDGLVRYVGNTDVIPAGWVKVVRDA